VIRDLAGRAKTHPLNNNDREVMSAARDLLLNEWEIVAGITRTAARAELDQMLG
jgi:RNA polymerase-interacting CarD/CdnL/TRCF family regulator